MLQVISIPARSHIRHTRDANNNNNNNGYDTEISLTDAIISILIIVFLAVIIIVAILYGSGYLTSCPRMKFQVNSVEVKLVENSNDKRKMAADLTVELKLNYKDNQTEKYFESLVVTLEYEHGKDHELLSSANISSVVQDYNNPHTVTFQLQFKDGDDNNNLLSNTVDYSMTKGEHVVQFALKIKGSYVWYHRGFASKCKVKATCHHINVGFSPETNFTTGTMIGAPLLCKHKH